MPTLQTFQSQKKYIWKLYSMFACCVPNIFLVALMLTKMQEWSLKTIIMTYLRNKIDISNNEQRKMLTAFDKS